MKAIHLGAFRVVSLLVLLTAAGCGSRHAPESTDGGGDRDSGGACGSCAGRCCGNQCVKIAEDPRNCGACGAVCPAGTQCIAGTCQCVPPNGQGARKCAAGEACCDGQCTSTQSDASHCGGCGTDCTQGGTVDEMCFMGQCGCAAPGKGCDAGQACCGGGCVDRMTDAAHCGACGKACDGGKICKAGTCVAGGECGGKTCLGDEVCNNGICIPNRPCNPPCPFGEGCVDTQGKWQCVTGACLTDRECPQGKRCMPVFVLGFGFCM